MQKNDPLHSIFINNVSVNQFGKIISVTNEDKHKYINTLKNWKNIYNNIIETICNYAINMNYDTDTFKNTIYQILVNTLLKYDKLQVFPPYIEKPVIIPKDTTLYRYVDSPKHCYANPHPKCYGRLTDPNRGSTFYLSFDQSVSKDEAFNTNTLVKYKTKSNIKANLFPTLFPKDKFFEKRLRKLCNLIFSLTTANDQFKKKKNKNRVKKVIYIATNKLFDIYHDDSSKVFIYPSTKVKENSQLGNVLGNGSFCPNKKNANIAIFDDVHFNNHGEPYSNYVKVDRIL